MCNSVVNKDQGKDSINYLKKQNYLQLLAAMREKQKLENKAEKGQQMPTRSAIVNLPLRHPMSASPTYPGSQRQIMVRRGRVSTTSQMALAPQGCVTSQGFLHSPLKQANLLGHSASMVQPSGCTGSSSQRTVGFPLYPAGQRHCAR